MDLTGSLVGGRYRIVRKLGAGGMGEVYVATQEPLGREVALKIVRGELAQEERAVERFRREAMTLSQLVHPHIVALYDFGEAEHGTLFFAMELLPGESLRQRLATRGRMLASATLPIVREICSALGAAHKHGVLHRDLKPDNVMLIEAFGRTDFVKLLDFGIAKAVNADAQNTQTASLTQSGMLVGTPGYLAPEVVMYGIQDDPRSDLYALGVTWFEMLTGRAPFTAATPVGVMMKHAQEAPPRVGDLVEGIPAGVLILVDKLLLKNPEMRPRNAEAVIEALDDIVGSGPNTRQPAAKTAGWVIPFTASPTLDGTAPFLNAGAPTLATPAATSVMAPAEILPKPVTPPTRAKRWPLVAAAGAIALAAVVAFLATHRPPAVTAPPAHVDVKPPDVVPPPVLDVRPPDVKPPDVKPPDVKPPDVKPPDVKPPVARHPKQHPAPPEKKPPPEKPKPPKLLD